MASTEKELEVRILEVGNRLASPPSSVDELLALLDQTESLLSRVAQSPSQSVAAALRPAMKALVAKELLEHSDMDVKVAVASCASEITRITAPDAPYDDNLMKVIFQMIVEAFGNLDDITSRSYSKRVSILETVAKVRSCVVMLDLECDAMILEMFHHFLKTISSNHPEKVFSLMETIMTLVLEESEDISSELLSCLLDSVQKDKEILPIARRLGEKVIGNCAVKLKPYLMKVVQSLCAREYSKIVLSICQENSDALEQNEITISGEILADDNKLSERTVSDELPQGSAKLEQEVGSPVKVGTVDKPSKLVVENGISQRENGDSMVEPTPPKKKPGHSRSSGQSKNIVAADISDSDNLESMDVKSDGTLDLKPKKRRGRKANSSVQMTDGTDHSRNSSVKEVPTLPSKRKGRSKETDGSQLNGPSGNEVESAVFSEPEEKIEHEEKNDIESRCRSDNEGAACVSSQTPGENILNATRRKRGRPSRSKVSAKSGVNTIADQSVSTSGLRSEDNDLKKETQAVNNSKVTPLISEGKSLRRYGKKVQSENAVDGETSVSVTSDSEAKPLGDTGRKGSKKKVTLRESSGEEQKFDIKQPKGKGEDEAGKLILKDDPSPKSGTKAPHKDQRRLTDGVKTQSRRKRARGTEEISEAQKHKTELDENLVGSRIRVWWPDDKRFYGGTVDEFNPISRKHKIVYDDGEIEELALKNERYEIDGHGTEIEGDKKEAVSSPNTSLNVAPLNKKAKTISDSLLEQAMTETLLTRPPKKRAKTISDSSPEQATPKTPLKSGMESGSGHDSLVIKRRGRPKGRPSTKLGTVSNDSAKTSSKSKEKVGRKSKDDTPRKLKGPSNKSEDDSPDIGTKDDRPRSGGKPKDATPKSGSKSKDVTPKTGRKLKAGTPKMISKSRDEPLEQTPKSAGKSKSDGQKPRPKGRPRKVEGTPKSKSATPKVGRKPKSKGGATPKTDGESSAGGASEKGKTMLLVSGTPGRAKGSVGGAGKKRKRKSHK